MKLYEKLIAGEEKLSLIGLGYVGMPIAVAFAKKGLNVIGFDLNKEKIELYKAGKDPTKEVGDETIKNSTVVFTSNEKDLQKAKFHIVAVPTPVNTDHTPDLAPVIGASEILGRNLTKGSIIRDVQKMFAFQFLSANPVSNAELILKLATALKE